MELKLSRSSLPTAIFNSSSFFPKQFTLLAQKWKLDFQRISWKGKDMSKKILVHVVKEGESLTSISKLYGVPIFEIAAANKEIADVDLVFQGQHLHIPFAATGYAKVCRFEDNKLHKHQMPNAFPSLRFYSRQWNQIFAVPSCHQLPLAKTTGSFLVLVLLVAFCIRCIMGSFQNIVARNLRHQASNKMGSHCNRTNNVRWKIALRDLRDPDSQDTESEPECDPVSSEQEHFHFEDISHAYTKLEGDYQKFLSECGMSNWGYWRGGSPQ